MGKPLFRFTVGNTNKLGILCLEQSIESLQRLYDVDVVVCFNGPESLVSHLPVKLINQRDLPATGLPEANGVSWKLYPPRLNPEGHEIFIDNDLILHERITEIDEFLTSDQKTLLLEEENRVYGRFERHVPKNLRINTGIFGLPPHFDFQSYLLTNLGNQWEPNAKGSFTPSYSWDEQGIVSLILSSQKYTMIPKESINNCSKKWEMAKGNHFIGLNREPSHPPFLAYMVSKLTHL